MRKEQTEHSERKKEEPEQKDHKVFDALKQLGIDYTLCSHPPVYTSDEAAQYWDGIPGGHPKNLFLRDDKGKSHYLVIVEHTKQVDLKNLRSIIGSSRLSFASDRRLGKHLGLTPGAVSAFGLINDSENRVEVIIDSDLLEHDYISFHPNVNTATLTISTADFKKFLHHQGSKISCVSISSKP